MDIPLTIAEMGEAIKESCNKYKKREYSIDQLRKDLKYLQSKMPDLYISALKERYVGKTRIKLVKAIMGE